MTTPHIHDRGYKRLFENRRFLQQLLESFVDAHWVKDLDFSTCQSIKKSYVSAEYKETTNDLLYKIKLKDQDIYILILLEFQSNVQRFMAVRVLHYIASVYLDLIEQKTPPEQLPPIFPIILYNGKAQWTAPTALQDLIQNPELLGDYALNFHYFKIAENAFPPAKLKQINNLVSTLFLADSHYDPATVKQAFSDLFDTHPDKDDIALLLNWFLQLVVHGKRPMPDYQTLRELCQDKMRTIHMLEETLAAERAAERQQGFVEGEQQGIIKGEQQGIIKGEQQGIIKSKLEIAQNMLQAGISTDEISQWTGLDKQEIVKLQAELAKH